MEMEYDLEKRGFLVGFVLRSAEILVRANSSQAIGDNLVPKCRD